MSSITITLKLSEIVYDIQNKAFLTGRSLHNGENHSHVANMQANDDEENSGQVLRSVTMAYSVLRNRLAEYLVGSDLSASNDMVDEKDDLTLMLSMPSNYNKNATRTIAEAAHAYIVSMAIADWFAITARGETADYTRAAADSLAIIEEALNKRVRPVRS